MENTIQVLSESIAIVAGLSGPIPQAIGAIVGALFVLFGGEKK